MPDKIAIDGFSTISGGVDSGSTSSTLPINKISWATNLSVRNELASPRPSWVEIASTTNRAKGDPVGAGRFQGALIYKADKVRDSSVLIVSGGVLYRAGPPDWEFEQVGERWIDPFAERVWMVQAEKYVVVQDGRNTPVIYSPTTVRQAGRDEVRIGEAMAYCNGRLWTTLPDGRSFVAGDISRGPSGTASERFMDAVLKVTENDFLAEGGSFSVPDGSGHITAMVVPAQDGTAPDIGMMVVFTREAAYQVNLPVDRDAWKDMRSPAIAKIQAGRGCVGGNAWALVNGDVVYRASDGVRSLKLARRNFETTWTNVCISHEIDRVIGVEEDAHRSLGDVSCAEGDRRWLSTAWGHPDAYLGTLYDGIVSMQLDAISAMFVQDPPAWEGVWTGLRTHQILAGQLDGLEEVLAVVRKRDGGISILKLHHGIEDVFLDGGRKRIAWSMETRELFSDTALEPKRLTLLEVSLFDIRTDVDIVVHLQNNGVGPWVKWGEMKVKVSTETCPTPEDPMCGVFTVGAQSRTELRLGTPPDECVRSLGRPSHTGYSWKVRFDVTGFCRFKAVRVRANPMTKEVAVECTDETVSIVERSCAFDDRSARII